MRNKQAIIKLITALMCLLLTSIPLQAFGKTKKVACNFAILMLNNENTLKSINLEQDLVTMKAGNKLKFFYQPLSRTYLYLYHIDPDGAYTLIYPETFNDYDKQIKKKEKTFIPAGEPGDVTSEAYWFAIDSTPGIETFYIVVSTERLYDLEKITGDYYLALTRKKEKLNGITDKLSNYLLELTGSLAEDNDEDIFSVSPEKPLPISGNIKGLKFNIQKIEAKKVYAKKIQITH